MCWPWGTESGPPGPFPLRSALHPEGLPGLSGKDAAKVAVGNLLGKRSFQLMRACAKLHIPCALENPYLSRLWDCKFALNPGTFLTHVVRDFFTDQCGDGTAWRKRTRLRAVHLDLEPACKHCTGRGVCSFSGRTHMQLHGLRDKKFLTSVAEPYPHALCRRLAKAFGYAHYAALAHQLSASWTGVHSQDME